MVKPYKNPFRGTGLPELTQHPLEDATPAKALISRYLEYAPTPLLDRVDLAQAVGVAKLWIKDESARMGLGSFKALGAQHAIARDADGRLGAADTLLRDRVYVTASAGNHGLSVAVGAQVFGARAVIYLADTVPEAFANRLRAKGAEVVRSGADYEASMAAAEQAAADKGWTLLSDSTWPGEMERGLRVMEGYLVMAAEIVEQIDRVPSHVLLQAGVGGMAAAVAAHLRGAFVSKPSPVARVPWRSPVWPRQQPELLVEHGQTHLHAQGACHAVVPGKAVLRQPAPLPDVENRVHRIGDDLLVQRVEHGLADARSHEAGVPQDLHPLPRVEDPAPADAPLPAKVGLACAQIVQAGAGEAGAQQVAGGPRQHADGARPAHARGDAVHRAPRQHLVTAVARENDLGQRPNLLEQQILERRCSGREGLPHGPACGRQRAHELVVADAHDVVVGIEHAGHAGRDARLVHRVVGHRDREGRPGLWPRRRAWWRMAELSRPPESSSAAGTPPSRRFSTARASAPSMASATAPGSGSAAPGAT